MKIVFILSLVFILNSCLFKTAEQIRREKLVDSLAIQMTELQKKTVDMNQKILDLQKEVSLFNGLIEEKGHEKEQSFLRGFKDLRAEIELLQEENKKERKEIEENNKRLTEQKEYLDKLLKTLDKISSTKKRAKRAKKKSAYKQAMADYKAKKYKSAKAQLLELEQNKKIKGSRRARIIHNLGMIEYIQKDYNEALVYFSRLFTDYPKSGYNKNGLYYLGHSFKRLKKSTEAKQAFQQVVTSFPKCWQAKNARKELKKMK